MSEKKKLMVRMLARPGRLPSHRWSSWRLVLAPPRPGRRRRPAQARPQLLGHDLHDRAGAAVLGGPGRCWNRPTTTTRLPFESECAACSAWSRRTITVKNDASCSFRVLTATRNLARGDPGLGGADLGVIGEIASEAHARLGPAPFWIAWPGGLPCPWNRGTVDAVACQQATRGKQWRQRSRPWIKLPAIGRLGCRVGWWGACGWGRACQHRPARSLHPGRGGSTRLRPRELLARSSQAAGRGLAVGRRGVDAWTAWRSRPLRCSVRLGSSLGSRPGLTTGCARGAVMGRSKPA
jgi:hypothetical protein